MRNIHIYIGLLVVSAYLSCDKADPIPDLDGEPGTFTSSNTTILFKEGTSISFFDQNELEFDVFTAINAVNQVRVLTEASSTDVTIENKNGIYKADFEDLGVNMIGDTVKLSIIPMVQDRMLDTIKSEILVSNPVEIVAPEVLVSTRKIDSFLVYSINSSQVDRVGIKIENKVNFDGTYEDIAIVQPELDTTMKDSLGISPVDLIEKDSRINRLDTIYYRITATTGDLSASSEVKVFLNTKFFGDIRAITLSNTEMGEPAFYNLLTGRAVTEDEAEVIFIPRMNTNDYDIQVADANRLSFVPYEDGDNDTFNFGDKLLAEELFNEGPQTSIIDNIQPGNQYLYRITRTDDMDKETEYIGVLRIDLINSVEEGVQISIREAVVEPPMD